MYIVLYKTMYNDNKYFYYTRRYIMTINIFIIHEDVFLLYEMMYNKNIYCHYVREYIMTTNISVTHERVYRVIQDDV